MKISWKERRMINRRIKGRIPPAVKACMTTLPRIMLIVSATVFISPDALAKVKANKAEVVFTQKTTEDVTYSKEELAKTLPQNPAVALNDMIKDEVTAVFKRMTDHRGNDKDFPGLQSGTIDQDTYAMSVAALKDTPTGGDVDTKAVQDRIEAHAQHAAGDEIKANSSLFQKMKSGLNFNFNLGNLFKKRAAPVKNRGAVRYGLIVQDIVPDEKSPKKVALGEQSSEELQYAGHADVVWTIGPVQPENKSNLFNVEYHASHESGSSQEVEQSLWSNIKLPSPGFTGNIAPVALDNYNKFDASNIPEFQVSLNQEEGYYSLLYQTKLTGEKTGTTHVFNVPVAGEMTVGRRYDDKWHILQTSANNILIDKRAPVVSVHYMNLDQRYKANGSVSVKGHNYGVAYASKAGATDHDVEAPEENYSATYSTDF